VLNFIEQNVGLEAFHYRRVAHQRCTMPYLLMISRRVALVEISAVAKQYPTLSPYVEQLWL
jgi:hypothetical protein